MTKALITHSSDHIIVSSDIFNRNGAVTMISDNVTLLYHNKRMSLKSS